MMRFMVRHFLLGSESERGELDSRLRLVLHSFLEDGEYARELFEAVSERVMPLFEASLEAAVAAGDIGARGRRGGGRATGSGSPSTSPAMLAFAGIAGAQLRALSRARSTSWSTRRAAFILRGIGMSDAAIAAGRRAQRRCTPAAD